MTGSIMTEQAREQVIKDKLTEIGRDCFPDDTDVTWHLRGIIHKGNYSFVEAEPSPATVGYPRFRFVLLFGQGVEPGVAGCYCLDNGVWSLLFTDPKMPSDWQSL